VCTLVEENDAFRSTIVEVAFDADGRVASGDPGDGEDGVGVHEVEHGRAVEPDVARVDAVLDHAAERVLHHGAPREHDALGPARRAGRVVHLRAGVVRDRGRVRGPLRHLGT